MTQANNIAVTLGWLVGSYKIANAEEMIVKSLKAQVKDLPKDGVLDLWYDMTNRKAKLNAGDWCSGAEIDAWKTALIEHAAVDTAADIEIMDEAGGPGDGDWVKIASAVGTDIRDSAISGKGLFATRSFSTGDVLVTDFMQKQNTDDPRTRWEQSDSCRYTNHSDKPNAFIRKLGETVELVADETIQPNEEITCNYRDASKTLGKAFFYTYRGKPYGNDTSAAAFMQKTAATLPDTFYGLPTFLKQAQTTDDILDRIANARSQTATEVSAGNAAAGNYRKGRFNYHGLRISIENPKGSVRSGTAADGTKWSNEMKSDYGYIRGTIGADGDPVDVFIGDDPKSELVFIVNQVNKSGSFDEHKVVLGVIDAKQARQTYLANYKPGWTGAGSVIGMTMQQFKDWLQSGAVNKPAVTVKQAGDLGTPKLPPVPELPWRDRVEVFARKPVTGEIYGGRWDADKSFALPGGGIDPGEDAATAAMREFMEETGIPISNARKLDVPSVDNPWSDEHRQRTGRNFAGARTHFVQADIAGEQAPGKLDVWNAGERGYYSPEAALQMMLANTNYMAPASAQRRIEILQGMQPQPAGEVKQASTQMDAAAKLRALLIEGNPDRPGEPERMHTSLTQLLQSLGYDVQRTPSVEYSDVPDADVAIGFSRGADRLRFSKAPVRIAVGSGGSLDGVPRVNHPRDRVNLSNPDEFNTLPVNVQRAHSTLTKGMRSQLTDLIPAVTVKQSMHHGSHIQGLKAIQPGPSRVLEGDSAVGMTMQQFKSWLRGDVTKPAESIKQAADLGIPELPQPKRTRVVMPYDDGYLLERMNNPKYPANLGRQRFPGGGIDAGETSQQAAAREMMEELGLSVKPEQLRSLGIHANADHGPEEYFELADHGIQPGNYTASIGGDKHIELIKGLLNSPHYWGAQLNTLQQPNPTTGMKQAANHTAITPCDNAVQALINMADTAAWRAVPKQVARLMKSAADIKQQVQKAMETLSVADPGYGYVYWHPKRNHLWAVLSDGDEQDAHDAWWKALSKIPGINKVITEAEFGPHGEHKDEWIQIKKARLFTKNSTINPFTLAGEPFGGPNAVTNSVVGALIGGGLGYGGGRLAEMLLPERHFERGRLSKNLALAGAVLGGTPGLVQGVTHMGMNHTAGDPSTYRSWLQPTNAQKVAPNSTAWRKHVLGKMAGAEPTSTQAAILRRSAKCAMATMSGLGNPGMRPINVDEFNNVIWHDPYSPPAVNAAAAGVVSGIQQHYGGASVLTPRHFIKGLAAAGVDAATATVAGGVLGVLGGLKPESQQTLQQMGLWSGLMRGSIGSIFGQ